MTPDQLRLLAELSDDRILGIVDNPSYQCSSIRESHSGGTARDEQWWKAHLFRETYPWGIAMTTGGDYFRERKVSDPAHAVTLTWRQITAWSESLTDEQRAQARRARMSHDVDEERAVVEKLLAPVAAEPEELALW